MPAKLVAMHDLSTYPNNGHFDSDGQLDTATWPNGWIVDTLLVDGQYPSWYGVALQEDGKVIAAGRSTWGASYPVLMRFWQ